MVRAELWPDIRDEHELHDLLHSVVALPLHCLDPAQTCHWPAFYERLLRTGRARTLALNGSVCWVATERLEHAVALSLQLEKEPFTVTKEEAVKKFVQGWLQIVGPTTAERLAALLHLDSGSIFQAFLAMEVQGLLLRGSFEFPPATEDHAIEWCERRILQRIHRLTLGALRKQVEAVSPATYMRWLLGWQHLAPQTQLAGEEGVLEALRQLEGFEAPAIEWERSLLPARIAGYDPRWLDQLCLSGAVGWGRISPHPAWSSGDGGAPRRVIPTNAAPITFYVRESADWLPYALAQQSVDEAMLAEALSLAALQIRALLRSRGACFANDIQRITTLTRPQTQHALWELATAGLAASDGFDQLRAMMDPRRKSAASTLEKAARQRSSAGRWSLLSEEVHAEDCSAHPAQDSAARIEIARRTDAALESAARMLLARYGILFRDLLARESNAPRWRDLLGVLRRLEARGEVRGGRFVSGFGGEQFALPQAVDSLRAARDRSMTGILSVAAADPMNLAGIVLPGERVPSVPGKQVEYCNGLLVEDPFVQDPSTHVLSTADRGTAAPTRRSSSHEHPQLSPTAPGLPELRLF
jgi:ATP-dependent Lhr-like helicase